jgi:L-threonylcarbamoyladenylate synthase
MPLLDARRPGAISGAARHIAAGELVGFPTETVYGLGARADDATAVAKIYAAKGRPSDHPLIVHVASLELAASFAGLVDEAARLLMTRFWPGPLTVIVPRRPGIAAAAAGGQASIGLRMPAHPVALALLQESAALGVPGIAAPSANRFGRISPTRALHVQQELGDELLVLDGGACPVGIESTIIDCTRARPALLRPGRLDRLQIEQALGMPLAEPDAASPRASGTLAAHYAPVARVRLMETAALRAASDPLRRNDLPQGLAVYSRAVLQFPHGVTQRLMPDDAVQAASELFSVLREIDAAGAQFIWVELPPPGAEWEGVRDRLQRAAAA